MIVIKFEMKTKKSTINVASYLFNQIIEKKEILKRRKNTIQICVCQIQLRRTKKST